MKGLGAAWEGMNLALDTLLDPATTGIRSCIIFPVSYIAQRALLTYVCDANIPPSLIWPEDAVVRQAFSQDLTPDEVATLRVLLALVMDTVNVIRKSAISRIEGGMNFEAVFATARAADDDTVELHYELQATLHTAAQDNHETIRLQWFPKFTMLEDEEIRHTTFVPSEGTIRSTTSGAVSVLERVNLVGSDFGEAAVPFILAVCRDGWNNPAFFESVFQSDIVDSVGSTSLSDAESGLITALQSWSG